MLKLWLGRVEIIMDIITVWIIVYINKLKLSAGELQQDQLLRKTIVGHISTRFRKTKRLIIKKDLIAARIPAGCNKVRSNSPSVILRHGIGVPTSFWERMRTTHCPFWQKRKRKHSTESYTIPHACDSASWSLDQSDRCIFVNLYNICTT